MTGTAITLTDRDTMMLGSAVNLVEHHLLLPIIAEYGTTYSGRATDMISGGGTSSAATCADRALCVAL